MMKWTVAVPLLGLIVASGARADDAAAVQAVYRDWMAPRAAELVADSARLVHALDVYCAAPPQDAQAALGVARNAWRTSLLSWERLSAVAIGAALDYRIQSKLDFRPTRPRMIRKAVAAGPAGVEAMDRIGAPAKGFPALEWLLWSKPMRPASPECRYAVQVAMEIEREIRFIERAFRESARESLDAAAANAALNELVNQWIGGLDRLRWADMEKPMRKAATARKKAAPEFLRDASGATAASWAARWEALRALAAAESAGSLASLLRARGHGKPADALARSVDGTSAAMKGLDAMDSDQIMASARELSTLRRLVERDVAPALGVRVGFSDADGD